jgi:hypothetical protein
MSRAIFLEALRWLITTRLHSSSVVQRWAPVIGRLRRVSRLCHSLGSLEPYTGKCARASLLSLTVVCPLVLTGCTAQSQHSPPTPDRGAEEAPALPVSYIASIDTMKESKDTEDAPLSDTQIAADINLSASLNVNYIAIATHYDNADYMTRWVSAVRATGKHVWFRSGFRGWGTDASGEFTSAVYLSRLYTFILTHAYLWRPGDIFDPNAEPENGAYWRASYGPNWSWQPPAPNAATDDFNKFLVDVTNTAELAFKQLGISGVITTVHSVDPWTVEHPEVLYPSTIKRMNDLVVVDAYPDANTQDPALAAHAWVQQLSRIHNARPHARIVIGEMGYCNNFPVEDTTQETVLKAELDALSSVPYLVGINYWVGAGTDQSGGYTHLFENSTGHWTLRPAAYVLASFYAMKLHAP